MEDHRQTMHERTAILMLAAAALLLPGAQAQALHVDSATLTDAVAEGPVADGPVASATGLAVETPSLGDLPLAVSASASAHADVGPARSEERRVGKECRSRW